LKIQVNRIEQVNLMMEERQTNIGLGCGAVNKIVYHQSYQEYIDKKIKLLDDAYVQLIDKHNGRV
jgi:hypothetical protein